MAELRAAGVGRRAVEHGLKNGRLFAKYRGVYAVGRPDLTVWGERPGDRAGLRRGCRAQPSQRREAPGACGRRRPARGTSPLRASGGRTRRCDCTAPPCAPGERAVLEGVPLTGVARTLLDLTAVIATHQLRRAIERAVELDLFDLTGAPADHDAPIRAGPARPSSARSWPTSPRTARLARARTWRPCSCRSASTTSCHGRASTTPPTAARWTPAWPGRDLVVEIDSWTHHRGRSAFTTDRAKDRAALLAGRRTARFTGDELERDPAGVAGELRALLGA